MNHKPFANKYEKHGAYHWGWYNKKKSYRDYVDFLKAWITEKSVLDVGAGDGLITHQLGICGIDDDVVAVRLAQEKGANVVIGDAYALTGKFDAVLMSHTLEHLEHPLEALAEARRVLKKALYIVVPKREGYFKTDAVKLKKMVESVGFEEVDGFERENVLYAKFLKV